MRKLIILFIGLAFFTFKNQAQTSVYYPFPDSNAVWNVDFYGMDPLVPHCNDHNWWSYVITGDTIINSNSYHKLYIPACNFEGNCSSDCIAGYSAAIRQDTMSRKVWCVLPDSINEYLLYDFSLNVGDSISVLTGCSFPISWIKVVSIDSIRIANNYRKRWNFSPNRDTVIEGIGSINNLLYYNCNEMGYYHFYDDYFLSCFQQNGQTLYPDTSFSCDIILTAKSILEKDVSISIFPNPNSGVFNISTNYNGPMTIEIYNIFGEIIYTNDLINKETIIDLHNISQGIYLARIIDREKKVTNKQIIIM